MAGEGVLSSTNYKCVPNGRGRGWASCVGDGEGSSFPSLSHWWS